MTAVSASAPGKVVLCGEYAVLDGAPAICMAVNRRAKARVTNIDGDRHRVSAPGYSEREGWFTANGRVIDWLQAADDYTIVDAVWRTLGPAAKGSLCIELDARTFVDQESGKKIGIGSSAALIVALVAALGRSCGVLTHASSAHRLFQHGVGSGADIATSVRGGLLEYRMIEAPITSLRWPDGLAYRLVWTGVPASTRNRLDRLRSTGQRTSRQQLITAAEIMARAWRSTSAVLSEYPAYIEALRKFSVDHDLGIFDAGHEQLATAAAAVGLVYKPCGAGGGDVGILLGGSGEQLDDFMSGQVDSDCRVLDCQLESNGVELELS